MAVAGGSLEYIAGRCPLVDRQLQASLRPVFVPSGRSVDHFYTTTTDTIPRSLQWRADHRQNTSRSLHLELSSTEYLAIPGEQYRNCLIKCFNAREKIARKLEKEHIFEKDIALRFDSRI